MLVAKAQARRRRRNRPAIRINEHCRGRRRFHTAASTRFGIPRDFVRTENRHSARSDPRNHRCRPRDSRTSGSVHLAYAVDASKFYATCCSSLTLRWQRGATGHDVAVGLRHPTRPSWELAILFVRVCLSALLGWAWLQGNSRARRLRSTVPALAGFGFPLRLPASPFAKAQTICSGPSEKLFRLPGERPLRSGSPQQIRGTKGRQHTCFAKIASLS
jgi:hypothetical protein